MLTPTEQKQTKKVRGSTPIKQRCHLLPVCSIIASQLREFRTAEAEGTLNDALALALTAGLVIGGLIEVGAGQEICCIPAHRKLDRIWTASDLCTSAMQVYAVRMASQRALLKRSGKSGN